jgi:hypothetical protein
MHDDLSPQNMLSGWKPVAMSFAAMYQLSTERNDCCMSKKRKALVACQRNSHLLQKVYRCFVVPRLRMPGAKSQADHQQGVGEGGCDQILKHPQMLQFNRQPC